jgi:hypothetical protein
MARCVLDSTDKTNLSRCLSEVPWQEDMINHRRIRFMPQQTKPHRRRRRDSLIALDDTLYEHVGSCSRVPTFETDMSRFGARLRL